MGSKSGGQKFQTTTGSQTNVPAPGASEAIQNVLSRSLGVASQPYTPYGGPLVAGFTPQQTQAFGQVGALQGVAQPYINAATGINFGALGSLAPQNWAQTVQAYENPMIAQIAGPTLANLQETYGQQRNQLGGQAILGAGGYGGRESVAQAELAREQGLAQGQTMANLYSQLYGQASGQAAQNAALAMQGAGNIAGLGTQALQTGLTGTNALLQSGALQQAQQQAALSTAYQQWLQQQGFPYAQTGWLASVVGGLAPELGGTTQGVQYTGQPQPSSAATNLGLAAAGAGFLSQNPFGSLSSGVSLPSASELPSNIDEQIMGAARGGRIGRQEGGELDLPETKGGMGGGSIVPKPLDITPKTNFPGLNLSSGSGGGGSGSGGGGGGLGDDFKLGGEIASGLAGAAKLAMTVAPLLLAKRGGRVHLADGGVGSSPLPMGLKDALGGLPINLLAAGRAAGLAPPSEPYGSMAVPFGPGVAMGYVGQPPSIKGSTNFPKLNLKAYEGKATPGMTMGEALKGGKAVGLDINKILGQAGGSSDIAASAPADGSAYGGRTHYQGGGKQSEAGSRGEMTRFFLDQEPHIESRDDSAPLPSAPLPPPRPKFASQLPPSRPRELGAINVPMPPSRPDMAESNYSPTYDPGYFSSDSGGSNYRLPLSLNPAGGAVLSGFDPFMLRGYAEGGRAHLLQGGDPVDASGTTLDDLYDDAQDDNPQLEPGLLKKQGIAESSLRPYAISPEGAGGIAQFTAPTARKVGLGNVFDPKEAIPAQGRYMGHLVDKFGDTRTALMAYYGGEEDPSKWGPRTRAYPDKVLGTGDPGGGSTANAGLSPIAANLQQMIEQQIQPQHLALKDPNQLQPGAFLTPAAAQALMAFGFGTAASPARTLGQAMGQGGLEGLKTYQNVINQQRQNQILQSQQENIASEIAQRRGALALQMWQAQRLLDAAQKAAGVGTVGTGIPSGGKPPSLIEGPLLPKGGDSATSPAPSTTATAPGVPTAPGALPPDKTDQTGATGVPTTGKVIPSNEETLDVRRYDTLAQQINEAQEKAQAFTGIPEQSNYWSTRAVELQKQQDAISDRYYQKNWPEAQKDESDGTMARKVQATALEHEKRLFPNGTNAPPAVNTGPMGRAMNEVLAGLEQLKIASPETIGPISDWAKALMGSDPAKAQGLEATAIGMIFQLAQQSAPPGTNIRQGEFMTHEQAAPGISKLPETVKYLVDNVIVPRTQYDIDKGIAMTGLDPSNPRTNIVRDRARWEAANPLHDYFERAGATTKAEGTPAATTPAQTVDPGRKKAMQDAWRGRNQGKPLPAWLQ